MIHGLQCACNRRVVYDLLDFDEEVYAGGRLLAAKWCAEPSVHGGRGDRAVCLLSYSDTATIVLDV